MPALPRRAERHGGSPSCCRTRRKFGLLFTVLLAVDGLAFIPVITAIIVGARLTGTVRGAPRPPGDHVIVVGLGNVGTSVLG